MRIIFCLLAPLMLSFTVSAQQEVSIDRDTGKLYGTLLIPDAVEQPPVALIIAGSGPTDRDCNSLTGIATDSYRYLAEDLLAEGIASLRYDKRGIAASAAAMQNEEDVTFDDYVGDASAWVDYLHQTGMFSDIIVIGHSEGSKIGMLVAAANDNVDKFISLAGAGRPLDVVVMEQLQGQLPDELLEEVREAFSRLKAGELVGQVRPALSSLLRPSVQPFLISELRYDPRQAISALTIPVMIVHGGTDIQVTIGDADLLKRACPRALGYNIADMNHVLKKVSSKDRVEQMMTYLDPGQPNHESLAPAIVNFIRPTPLMDIIREIR